MILIPLESISVRALPCLDWIRTHNANLRIEMTGLGFHRPMHKLSQHITGRLKQIRENEANPIGIKHPV